MELENSRPTAADRGENSRTPQGRKEKRDAGEKTGKKSAKQGRFRRFLPRFSFFLPFFLSSRREERNVDGEERTFFLPDSQLTPTKDEQFMGQKRKRSCNFRAVDVPLRRVVFTSPWAVTTNARASFAPHPADRRAHPDRTPTGPNGVARAAPLLLKNAPESSPERHWA